MRAFVCSYLDEALQAQCRDVGDVLVNAGGGRLRAVPEDSAHLTYAFMGSLPDERLPLVSEVAGRVAAALEATAIVLGAPEVLYGGSEARLVHLPVVEGREWLAELARTITDAARAALPGVDVALTPQPHVTLARFRRGTRRRNARQVEDCIAGDLGALRLTVRVDAVQVAESLTASSGARYTVRSTHRLGCPT